MRYDAFISYRHSPLDMQMAKKIHSGLETFKVPSSVQKSSGKKNIKRVFRDQEELPIGSDLDDNIEAALRESEYLIVICSPRTPESFWVEKEIETFIKMHDRNHVLAVLIEGEPDEAFPKALLSDEFGNPVEPLAADIRGESDLERKKKLSTELLRLAAPLLHCTYDDLRQRHRERKIKRMAALMCSLTGVVAALGISFAIYNAYMAGQIKQNYDTAVENYNLAMENYNAAIGNYEEALANQSKYLADTSLNLLEKGDREGAVLVALEALQGEVSDKNVEFPYVQQAEYALSEALYTYDYGGDIKADRVLKHDLPINDIVFSEDGRYLLSLDTGYKTSVWDIQTGELITEIESTYGNGGALEHPIAYGFYNDEIILCTGEGLYSYDHEGNTLWKMDIENVVFGSISAEDNIVFCVTTDELLVISLSTKDIINRFPKIEEFSFGNKILYEPDTNSLLIDCFDFSNEEGLIALYMLDTNEIRTYKPVENSISQMAFSYDGSILCASIDYASLFDINADSFTEKVEKIDIQTGDREWEFSFDSLNWSFDTASSIMKSRSYEDAFGDIHNEVIISTNNIWYTLDQDTGEQIVEKSLTNPIRSLYISKESSFGYIGESNGDIEIVDLTDGKVYSDYTIKTGYILNDLQIKSGVLAVRSFYSSDVLLLKTHDGKNKETIVEQKTNIHNVYTSISRDIFVIQLSENDEKVYLFYDMEGNELGQISSEEFGNESVLFSDFVGNGEFVIIDRTGGILNVDIQENDKKTLQIELPEFGFLDGGYVTENGEYAIVYGHSFMNLVDLSTMSIIQSWKDDTVLGNVVSAIVSEDGEYIYLDNAYDGLWCWSTHSTPDKGIVSSFNANMVSNKNNICISRDGKHIAVCCVDANVRILNSDTLSTEVEIPFAGRNNIYMYFTDSDSELILQGDNYYLHVFNMENSKIVYTSEDQYNTVLKCYENKDENLLAVETVSGLLMLRKKDDFLPVAFVENGCGYIMDSNEILSKRVGNIYKFPFQSVDSLVEDAKEQFPNASLTENERLKYHISNIESGLN